MYLNFCSDLVLVYLLVSVKKVKDVPLSYLTKLKYAGLSLETLIHIYSLFVRSTTEYCSVAWYDSLTQQQHEAIESLQVVAIKILDNHSPIKADKHFDYDEALKQSNLSLLFSRRENGMLVFG